MVDSESYPEDRHVGRTPKHLLAGAIGAEDGRCAFYYGGVDARCSNEATHWTWKEWRGEHERVEMCEKHVRDGEGK